MFRNKILFHQFKNIRLIPTVKSSSIISYTKDDKLDDKRNNKLKLVDDLNESLKKDKKLYHQATLLSGTCTVLLFLSIPALEPSESHQIYTTFAAIAGSGYWHMYSRGARDGSNYISICTDLKFKEMDHFKFMYKNKVDIEDEYRRCIDNLITVTFEETKRWKEMVESTVILTAGSCLLGLVTIPLLYIPTLFSFIVPYTLGSYFVAKKTLYRIHKKYLTL